MMNPISMYVVEVEVQDAAGPSGVDLVSHDECSGKELENETLPAFVPQSSGQGLSGAAENAFEAPAR